MNGEIAFGPWLKGRRKFYGYTQRELAEIVGCSPVTIEKIEEGKNRPSRQLAELLAQALGVEAAEYDTFVRFARGILQPPAHITGLLEVPAAQAVPEVAQNPPVTDRRYANLPGHLTLLVGREKEVEEACELLRRPDVRLVTLTGPGGIGKTRLGVRVAEMLYDDFKHGVFFVPLPTITDPGLVVSCIATALDVKEAPGRPPLQSLKDYIFEKEILLLLDNFEQVIEAAPVVVDLLTACRGLKVLVTSREVLQVRGEHQFPVSPLELPDLELLPGVERLLEFPSITLFVERAQSVKDDFELTEENSYSVAALCSRLEGIPLSIELAAARVKLFQPQAILARLDNSLKLLTGGPRDLPARHQTLRDTIEWSYNLLQEDEQALFARMGVFVGGCTMSAVEAVCGDLDLVTDPLDGLESLLDKSLLNYWQPGSSGQEGEPRFSMLGVIREYALERLLARGERDSLGRSHTDYYLALAEEAAPELTGPEQKAWFDRLENEHDNLRAALSWSLDHGESSVAARFGAALWRFWYVRSHFSEGRRWLELTLESENELPTGARAVVLLASGWLAYNQGDYERAATRIEEGIELGRESGNLFLVAEGLYALGNVHLERGDNARAAAFYEESLSMMRELGHKWGTAVVLNGRGNAALRRGDLARAVPLLEESLAISREIGDLRGMAVALLNLGMVAHQQGESDRALGILEESLAISRDLKDRRGVSSALNDLGLIALEQDDWQRAMSLLHESLALKRQLGDKENIALSLERLAIVALARGEAMRAVRLVAAMRALREAIGAPMPPDNQSHYFGIVAGARARIDEATYKEAWAAGRAMTLDEAISYALSQDSNHVES